MNYFLAYWLFVSVFMMGRPVPGTVIGGFVEGYPAKESGLQAGDRIARINEQPVRTWVEMTEVLQEAPAGELLLTVERPVQGKIQTESVRMTPHMDAVKDIFGENFQMKRLGVTPSAEAFEFEKYGFFESLSRAWQTEIHLAGLTHKAIFYLIIGKLSMKSMAGPIGIVAMTGSAAKLGLPYVLQLTAHLSVSLAVINLLPIPALDGGHLLFLLIEAVRRKRVSLEFQERVTQVGFVLLMVLMVFILYNDLANLQAFEKLKELFHLTK
ncbi:MAG TPA: RIP metalloprotease RseP, partial [bacterium]|nr:RIP metalloprotease RseP [bacterium]